MKQLARRAFAALLTVLMLFTVLPLSTLAATTVSVLDGQVSVTDSVGNGTVSGGTVTIQAKGGFLSQTTNNITITNESDVTGTLTFDYTASNYSSFSMSAASGTYSALVSPGQTVTMSIKGKRAVSSNTATLKLSNFSLAAAAASSKLTINYDSALGSVTADGAAAASGTVLDVDLGTAVALVATPATGATFLGWINANTHAVLSTAASFSAQLAEDTAVKAVFVNASSAPHFAVGAGVKQTYKGGVFNLSTYEYYTVPSYSYIFDNLTDASAAAAASSSAKYIVLLNDGTLPAGDYTIPAGVNLLIPYENTNKFYMDYPESTGDSLLYTTPSAYRTLTLAEGANLTVNGKVSLSAKHRAANGAAVNGGSPTGPISFVRMEKNSNIVVKNGGVLYAWGFIVGEGTVTAENGASVHENFQIMDFRGGNQTTQMKNGVFPVNQYYVQNIEVPLVLQYGAKEYSCLTMYMQSSLVSASVAFIGPSGAMFNLESGYVTKEYDGAVDRLYISLNGDMTIKPISIDLGLSKMDSEDYVMPLGNNLSMFVNSGDILLSQDVAMLPGAEMFIAESATCSLSNGVNVYVYDADEWGTYVGALDNTMIPVQYAPGKTYTRTEADLKDAMVVLNGTMDGSLGYLYTTAGGANVISDGTGVIDMVAGTKTVTYQFTQVDTTYHEIPIVPAVLTNADGSQVFTTSGRYEYMKDAGVWCNHVAVEIPDSGKAATCTETGLTNVISCACGQNTVPQETIPALGHTAGAAADCTNAQTCTVCGEELQAALGHTAGAAADCTNAQTCTVCGAELQAALGHTWVEADCDTAKTCSACGVTEGEALGHTWVEADCDTAKTCSVCGATEGEALGHTWVEADCDTAKTCSVCGATEGEALGHTWVEADCDTAKTCSVCGATEGEALGHSYFYPCDAHCQVCGELTNENAAHNVAHVDAVAATCYENGNIEYWYCTDCGTCWADEALTQQTNRMSIVIPMGHPEATYVAAKEATCTETGNIEYWYCEACGQAWLDAECTLNTNLKAVVLPMAEHVYFYPCDAHCMNCGELTNENAAHNVAHVDAVEATCTATGNVEYWYCADCGACWLDEALTQQTNRMSIVTFKDHDYSADCDATCNTCGGEREVEVAHEYFNACDPICMVCYEETREVAHNIVHVDAVEAVDCQTMGNIEYWYCDVCGQAWTDEALTMMTNLMSVKTGYGEHQYFNDCDPICMVCNEETREVAHNVVHVEAVAPTCQALGNIEYWYCDVCGQAWADEAQTMMTNLMSVKLGTVDHNYVGGACEWCGEVDPDAPVEEGTVVASKVAGTVMFTIYELSDGSHKLVVTGTGTIPTWDELANYSETLKTIEIGEGIVNIGYAVFQNLSALESVSLPSTLTTITGAAFNNDKNLTTINLEEGLTTIGYKAFYGTGLVEVTIPNSVTTMGTWVFADCKQLTTVTFGASKLAKKTLPARTFSGCTALKNVDLGSRLSTIDDYAFFNCGLENLYLPANIKVVDNAAFYSSASLKTVEIADGGAIYLGWASFYRCTALESFDMGDSVTQIGSWVFTACAELTSIELPETVTSIGRRTFSWCSGLESIALPSGVTVINAELFYSCTSLAEVTMSADVTEIGSKAFYKCLALTSLEYPESATVAEDAFTASGLA